MSSRAPSQMNSADRRRSKRLSSRFAPYSRARSFTTAAHSGLTDLLNRNSFGRRLSWREGSELKLSLSKRRSSRHSEASELEVETDSDDDDTGIPRISSVAALPRMSFPPPPVDRRKRLPSTPNGSKFPEPPTRNQARPMSASGVLASLPTSLPNERFVVSSLPVSLHLPSPADAAAVDTLAAPAKQNASAAFGAAKAAAKFVKGLRNRAKSR